MCGDYAGCAKGMLCRRALSPDVCNTCVLNEGQCSSELSSSSKFNVNKQKRKRAGTVHNAKDIHEDMAHFVKDAEKILFEVATEEEGSY